MRWVCQAIESRWKNQPSAAGMTMLRPIKILSTTATMFRHHDRNLFRKKRHLSVFTKVNRPNVALDDEEPWRDATLRLLSEPWKSQMEPAEAQRTLDWWIRRPGGSVFAIKLMEKMRQEMGNPSNRDDPSWRDVLDESRIRAMVERWAIDYSTEQRSCEILEPRALITRLESYRSFITIDQSIFNIIHRTTKRHDLNAIIDESLNKENLLAVLSLVEITGDETICPSKTEIDHILRYAVMDSTDPVEEWAQNVLDAMWSISRNYEWARIRPNFYTYHSVLRAWLKSKEPNKTKDMQRLINEMEELSFAGVHGLFPGKVHYTLLLSAYAETGDVQRAFDLMKYLKSRYETTGLSNYEPTGKMYGVCMAALSRSENPDVSMAETLRNEMFEIFDVKFDKNILPRSPFWTSYIQVLANVGTDESLEKAERVLDEMRTDNGRINANSHHYGPIIRGWTKLQKPERAEALLMRMIEKHASGHLDVKPDAKTFLDVTNAWSRSGDPHADERIRLLSHQMDRLRKDSARQSSGVDRKDADDDLGDLLKMLSTVAAREDASQAEKILYDSIKLVKQGNSDIKISGQHYQAVITAWSRTKSSKSMERAVSLLSEMLDKYDEGDQALRPTEHGFTGVITACARSGRPDCGEIAQRIFDTMCKRFHEGDEVLRPSMRSYSALMNAWASAGKPDRAEDVLLLMHDDYLSGNISAQPSVIAFNTVLSAWSKETSEEALERATQIFRLMHDMGESHSKVDPDIISYTSLIACCIKSISPRRVEVAEVLLREAKDRYANGKNECRPNCMIYGAVIQTIARSGVEGAADKAGYYLQEMLTLADFDPRQVLLSHNAVIGALGKEADKVVALKKAEALVNNLIELSKKRRNRNCLPNKFTYSQLLSVLSKTTLPDKSSRARAVMKEMEELRVDADDTIQRILRFCE